MSHTSLGIKRLVVGQMAENCYLVSDIASRETLIIDPGDDPEYVSDIISREDLRPISIVATHGHFDHIMGVGALQLTYNLPFFINNLDKFLVDRIASSARHFLGLKYVDLKPLITSDLREGNLLKIGKVKLRVITTPGHTPGSISLYEKNEKLIFVGDLLFEGGAVGRTDFAYSSEDQLKASLKIILGLPEKTTVYPGHGEDTNVKSLKNYLSV